MSTWGGEMGRMTDTCCRAGAGEEMAAVTLRPFVGDVFLMFKVVC